MQSVDKIETKRQTLNIRIRAEQRGLIDRAAIACGKNRTDFILEAACTAAEEALLQQLLLRVDSDAYDAFLARLDAPPQPNDRLRRTMQEAPPWDKG